MPESFEPLQITTASVASDQLSGTDRTVFLPAVYLVQLAETGGYERVSKPYPLPVEVIRGGNIGAMLYFENDEGRIVAVSAKNPLPVRSVS